jgi:hypothetical protein
MECERVLNLVKYQIFCAGNLNILPQWSEQMSTMVMTVMGRWGDGAMLGDR